MNGAKASGKEYVAEIASVRNDGKLQSRRARYSFCLGFRKCRSWTLGSTRGLHLLWAGADS